MSSGVPSGTNLLLRADRARRNPGAPIRPFDLWRLADGAVSSVSARRILYRHALIHAGLLADRVTGAVYPSCPDCGETIDG